VAVASGGETTLENLLSACESCNHGKADRAIEQRAIRPDADLLYLETQQEVAELQRYQQAKAELDRERARVVDLLQNDWVALSGLDWTPTAGTIRQLMGKYSPEVVEQAMADVAVKVGSGYLPTSGNRWIGYLYKVAEAIARENEYEIEA
jgi:hypothetical protein